MMDKPERSALFKAINAVIREYGARVDGVLRKFLSDEIKALSDLFEERIKSLPEPKQGERGEKGEKGDTGERGPEGVVGISGLRGEAGPAGERGEKGDRGEQGRSIKGDKGDPGERGERGLPGERGVAGSSGERGVAGSSGERGEIGERGLAGERGEKGIDGKDGRDAKDGRDGRDGKDGINGRDALELEIVEAEEGKSYPRGTFATHRGGLVRIAGNNIVQVVVRGIDTLDIVQGEDLRSFTVRVQLTDGHAVEKQFFMPVVLYRGVHKSGAEYLRGDSVTQDRSTWTCVVERTTVAPATPNNKDWVLSVRAGRDGKDLRPEEPKPLAPISLR